MPSKPELIERLGITHPILQAPMAGVSTPRLAAAVTEAGGLGALGLGAQTVAQARDAIAELRSLTAGPFALNVFCHRPAQRDAAREAAWIVYLTPEYAALAAVAPAKLNEIYTSFRADPAQLELLLEASPAAASFHFGLPSPAELTTLKDAGILTLASITNLAEAALAEAAGIDALIAQGAEAGGHRGVFDPDAPDERLGTAALVEALAPTTSLPIVAAGGIMNGADIAAMLRLGAAAAQLGTAFVASPESAAGPEYRAALRGASPGGTELTTAISGRPARGLTNRLIELGRAPGAPLAADYPLAYDAGKQLHAAAQAKGDGRSYAAHWAGAGAFRSRELPAGELVGVLAAELGVELEAALMGALSGESGAGVAASFAAGSEELAAGSEEFAGESESFATASFAGRWGSSEDRDPHLILAADGALSGSDGCNRMVGRWRVRPEGPAFEGVATTRMFCADVDTWLSRLATAELRGDRLDVFDADGSRIGELPRVN